ncbi:MAG: heme-binding protein, partial [Rhodoplanes sp.]
SNPGLAGLKDISGVIVLGGGLPIRVGNEVIGSVGVGGAPSADRDEACAKAAIDQVADQLK